MGTDAKPLVSFGEMNIPLFRAFERRRRGGLRLPPYERSDSSKQRPQKLRKSALKPLK
jgi:hypothetical protein